jgi:hypothetical protein
VNATNGGIVVEADKPFEFNEVELYQPPDPDNYKLLEATKNMVDNLTYYSDRINLEPINIKFTAQKYLDFIKAVLNVY